MKNFTYIIFFLLATFCHAQNINPPKGKVYNDTILPVIYITINPDSLNMLYKPGLECSDHEYPADFIFSDGISPNDTIKNIGFRFRGYSSRLAKKKSFKVSFNTFE